MRKTSWLLFSVIVLCLDRNSNRKTTERMASLVMMTPRPHGPPHHNSEKRSQKGSGLDLRMWQCLGWRISLVVRSVGQTVDSPVRLSYVRRLYITRRRTNAQTETIFYSLSHQLRPWRWSLLAACDNQLTRFLNRSKSRKDGNQSPVYFRIEMLPTS